MERLCLHIAESLVDGDWDLTVVGPTGCARHLPHRTMVYEVRHRPLPVFLLSMLKAVWSAKHKNTAVVIAGSGLTAPFAWWAAKRARARFVVYLHGLDIVAQSKIYQSVWVPFIRCADLILVNSANTRSLAMQRGIPSNSISILHPGTELVGPDESARRVFRAVHGLGDRPVLLSVGRLTPRKGLEKFVRLALPEILAQHPDAVLMVIGGDANNAVSRAAESQYARISNCAIESGVSSAVMMLPSCDDEALTSAYRAADVHVFPVLDLPGDVEGFGMVAIEAAAHGLPSIGFRVGGVPDAIVDGISGSLIDPGDYHEFARKVDFWLARSREPLVRARCFEAATAFEWSHFKACLRSLLEGLRGKET